MKKKRGPASGKNAAHEAYVDLLHPLARELGDVAGELVGRVLQPVRALIWGYDKIVENFGPALKRALASIPPDRLIEPNPAVAVPVFLSLTYTGHEDPIRSMFAKLLASSMDSKTAKFAHPTFASIIRDLVPDEARMLHALLPDIKHRTEIQMEYEARKGGSRSSITMSLFRQACSLDNPDIVDAHLTNLARLSLLDITHDDDLFLVDRLSPASADRIALQASDFVSHSNAIGKHATVSQLSDSILRYSRLDLDKDGTPALFRCSFTQVVSLTKFGAMLHRACLEERRCDGKPADGGST